MGRWNEMKEPESLEDYAARLAQQDERQPMGLSAGGGPLSVAQPAAARGAVEGLSGMDGAAVPRPTPRPVGPEEWVQLEQHRPQDIGQPGIGYYTYGTVPKGQPGHTADAQWAEPNTIKAVQSAGDRLAMGKEFTPLGVGNISLKNGRSFQPDHREHDTGNRVDFRPVRIDKAPAPVNYKSPDYDRTATQRAIRAIQATGQANRIFFNDPDIGIEGVEYKPGHDDHFHVEFKR